MKFTIVKDFITYLTESTNSKSKGIRVFCDMDGVLTDFDRGFKRLRANVEHLTPKEYEKKHGKDSKWPLIDHRGIKFWKRLPWSKDGRELWDYIQRYSPIILTAPSKGKDAVKGKIEWIDLNLGINEKHPPKTPEDWDGTSRVIISANKELFVSGKTDILIDDRRSNIEKWTSAGGTGILHNDSTDTIRILEQIVSKFSGQSDTDADTSEEIETTDS